jgi:hypothetical protein
MPHIKHVLLEDVRKLYEQGYKYKDIAEQLNIPYSSILHSITLLHKHYGMKYRLNCREKSLAIKEFIKNYLTSHKVVPKKELVEELTKAGFNTVTVSNKMWRYIRSLRKAGFKVYIITIKPLYGFIKPEFRKTVSYTIYYTDYDELVNYLTKILDTSNKRSLSYSVKRLKLPQEYINKLIATKN